MSSIRRAIRGVIPYRQRAALRRLPRSVRLVGRTVRCNCCGWRFRRFETFKGRPNARCPWCGALERHRLLGFYLPRRTPLRERPLDVLHIAPEEGVGRVLRRAGTARVVSVDLEHPLAERRMDIRALDLPSEAFDLVLCSHVLEHVWEDRAAMAELYRVLRPGGLALVMVPYDEDSATTLEDESVVDPAERLRLYGQEDHVRFYGRDLIDRLRETGFEVEMERYATALPAEVVRRYALVPGPIFRCRRPEAAPATR